MAEQLTGSQLIADLFSNYGVTHVFFVPTILNHSLYQMEQRTEISRIVPHTEKAAAYMADGYARASGRVGVCMAQTVGAANLAAGLRDGSMAASPMIAITGGPFSNSRDRFQYQEVNDQPMFAGVTKSSTRIESLDQVAPALRQAFRVATTGRPGIAHLEFVNHHGDAHELEVGELDASADERFGQLPPFRPSPDQDEVVKAAELLAAAERPVIVAGGGVRYSDAKADLVAFAEALSIPVAASLSGKDVIPADHPLAVGVVGLYSREAANRIVAEADLVFFIGTKTGSLVSHSWRIPRQDAKVVQCDISGDVLGLNYRNDASLVGDAKVSLELLGEAAGEIKKHADRTPWLESVQSAIRDWYADNSEVLDSDAVPIRPERLCKEISNALPSNGVLVACTGHAGVWSAGFIDLKGSDQIYLRSAGSLGWAFPGAIGAQLALPDRPVVCFNGDGGIWYHIAELETMARWNIPATIVVNNNSAYNQGIGLWTDAYEGELTGRHGEMWRFEDVDFAALARGMGVEAIRVEQPGDLAGALKTAIATDGPFLIDVVTDVWARAPKAWLPE